MSSEKGRKVGGKPRKPIEPIKNRNIKIPIPDDFMKNVQPPTEADFLKALETIADNPGMNLPNDMKLDFVSKYPVALIKGTGVYVSGEKVGDLADFKLTFKQAM